MMTEIEEADLKVYIEKAVLIDLVMSIWESTYETEGNKLVGQIGKFAKKRFVK